MNTSLISLFLNFAKIGVTTFGGGYAMLPILERECVEKNKWVTTEDLMDYYAIGQCTPGIIAVNTATFVGYKQRGIIGGIIATLGIVFPSFIIISAIASFFRLMQNNYFFIKAFNGIRIAVSSMLTVSIWKMAKKSLNTIETFVYALIILIFGYLFNLSPVILTILTVIYSVLHYLTVELKDIIK